MSLAPAGPFRAERLVSRVSKKNNAEETETTTPNRTVTFHAFATVANPTRASYRIPGHPGCLVIERSLFANPEEVPQTLILNIDLVEPRANVKVGSAEKEAEKLAKAEARAQKAEEKLAAQKAKAEAAAAKAQAALEAAKARVSASA